MRNCIEWDVYLIWNVKHYVFLQRDIMYCGEIPSLIVVDRAINKIQFYFYFPLRTSSHRFWKVGGEFCVISTYQLDLQTIVQLILKIDRSMRLLSYTFDNRKRPIDGEHLCNFKEAKLNVRCIWTFDLESTRMLDWLHLQWCNTKWWKIADAISDIDGKKINKLDFNIVFNIEIIICLIMDFGIARTASAPFALSKHTKWPT